MKKRIVSVLLWGTKSREKNSTTEGEKKQLMESRCFHPTPAEMDLVGFEGGV